MKKKIIIRKKIKEEIANVAGSGNIAGIGVGAKGEPGVDPKKRKSFRDFWNLFRRKPPV